MNLDKLKESLAIIQGEIYKAQSDDDLEKLRKQLVFCVMYIENKQGQVKEVA